VKRRTGDKIPDSGPQNDEAVSASVGQRVRKLRKRHGLSLAEFAKRIDRSAAFVSMIERDRAKPSMNTLQRIGEAFDMEVRWLFEVPTAIEGLEANIVRAEARSRLSYSAISNTEIFTHTDFQGLTDYLLSPSVDANVTLGLTELDPGALSGDEMLRHKGDLSYYVLHGQVEIQCMGESRILEKGDTVFIAENEPYTYSNPTNLKSSMLWAWAPFPIEI
jgi:transcriptional regulator with XRE-family HTH domain